MDLMRYSNNRFLMPIVKKTTLRLKLSIKQRWQRFFFGIAFSASSGKIIIPSAIEQLDITNSSTVLNKKSKIFRTALKNCTIAEKYRFNGLWHEGVALQNEILNEL